MRKIRKRTGTKRIMASTARRGKGKSVVVDILSSSSTETEEEDEIDSTSSEEESSGSVYDEDDDDYDGEVDEEDGEEEEENKKAKQKPLDEAEEGEVYEKILNLLKGGKTLDTLKLEECKTYLRKLKLRVVGTKSICIQRIQDYWRIKDGKGEKLYPRSSFNINCTGDVCKGDVVLFKQMVYEKFDVVSRGANVIGKRTIAGRIVKESYGAAKQQHTFTVEILWSKGVKVLPALFPMLVKGRNLYRLKTYRQCWNDEAERARVLLEKHKRGAAARHTRAIAEARYADKGMKRQASSSKNLPTKWQRQIGRLNAEPQKQNKGRSRVQQEGHMAENDCATHHSFESSFMQSRHMVSHQNAYHRKHTFNNHSYPQREMSHTSNAPAIEIRSHVLSEQYALNNLHNQEPIRNGTSSSPINRSNCRSLIAVSPFGSLYLSGFSDHGLRMLSPVQRMQMQNYSPASWSTPAGMELHGRCWADSCCPAGCIRFGRPCSRRH